MTIVNPPAKVLVTEKGYSVRGTVRTPSKGDYLKKLFEKEGERFEYVLVEDITAEGAFDEAVKGVQGVLHTASPVAMAIKHPDELIKPAVQGTLSVLTSVDKYGTEVGRVVITSSCAAILEPHEGGYVYTEKDWNDFSLHEVEQKSEKAAPIHQYRTSKTLAEQNAWRFEKEKRGNGIWLLFYRRMSLGLVLNFFGCARLISLQPLLQETAGKDSLNFSAQLIYDAVVTPKTGEALYSYAGKLALAHVLALQKEEAGGERIIVSAGYFAWQDLYDALSSPSLDPPFPDAPKGSSERGAPLIYSGDLCNKLFGIGFRGLRESARDTVFSVRERH